MDEKLFKLLKFFCQIINFKKSKNVDNAAAECGESIACLVTIAHV